MSHSSRRPPARARGRFPARTVATSTCAAAIWWAGRPTRDAGLHTPGRQEEGGRGPGCRPLLQGVHPRAVIIVDYARGRAYVRPAKDLHQELLASSAKRPKLRRARIAAESPGG